MSALGWVSWIDCHRDAARHILDLEADALEAMRKGRKSLGIQLMRRARREAAALARQIGPELTATAKATHAALRFNRSL